MTQIIRREMLDFIRNAANRVALVSGTPTLGAAVSGLSRIDTAVGGRTLTWTAGFSVIISGKDTLVSSNSATSNALNFSVPQGVTPTNLIVFNTVTGTADVIIPLTDVPSYAGGDGPYFVRRVSFTI